MTLMVQCRAYIQKKLPYVQLHFMNYGTMIKNISLHEHMDLNALTPVVGMYMLNLFQKNHCQN